MEPNAASARAIPHAATSAAAAHDVHFLQAITQRIPTPESRTAVTDIVTRVAEHYARGDTPDAVGDLLVAIAGTDQDLVEAIVTSLEKGWSQNRAAMLNPAMLNEEVDRAISAILPQLSRGTRGKLLKLAVLWGRETFQDHLTRTSREYLDAVQDGNKSNQDRLTAARQLIQMRDTDPQAARELLNLITPRTPPQFSAGLITAVSGSHSAAVGAAIVGKLSTLTPSTQEVAVGILLKRTDWTEALLDATEKEDLVFSRLTLSQRQSLSLHPDKAAAKRATQLLARGGGVLNPDRQQVIEEYMPATQRTGNANLGKLICKKHCLNCHMHQGEGADIGPDLTGMAVYPKEELLVHILDPSRSVEGNFRQYLVATEESIVLSGLLASETRTSIELIDVQGKHHVVLRDVIESLIASDQSVMPAGFEKQISMDEMAHLLQFLAQRGKFQPIPLDKVATVISTLGMLTSTSSEVQRMIFSDWKPKTFDGIPFLLVDPKGRSVPNCILLHSPGGDVCRKMPKEVTLPCNGPAKAIHFLSGIGGWSFPTHNEKMVSMIVRLHYEDGNTEDHPLLNGVHFADYVRRVYVPESKLAFMLGERQLRYLAIHPNQQQTIQTIELVDGGDNTAPIVMAVTVEAP